MAGKCQVVDCVQDASTREYCEMHYRRVLKTGDPGPPGPMRSRGICKADLCEEEVDAKGLCHGHYQLVLRKSRLLLDHPLATPGRRCSLRTCDRPHKAKGYCGTHYKRVLAHGDPQESIPIRTARGRGTLGQDGYRYVPVPRESRHLTAGSGWVGEHRLVMALHLGRALTSDEQVHHINGDRADNRLGNLELSSTSHPSGRRIDDLLEFCMTMLDRYSPEFQRLDPIGTN
jgi:hypothetical protein